MKDLRERMGPEHKLTNDGTEEPTFAILSFFSWPTCTETVSHTKGFKVVLQKSMLTQIVNLFFILVVVKDKLTDLWGSWLSLNDFINTFCAIKPLCEHPRRAR